MNALVIEQKQDETRLAFEVNQSAAINRIRLARAKVASQAMDEGPKAPITVSFNFKSKPLATPPNLLRLEIVFRMAGIEEKEEGNEYTPEKNPDDKKPETVVLV